MNLKMNGNFKTTICLLGLGFSLLNASAQTPDSLLLDFGPTAVASPYLTLDPAHNAGTVSGSDTSWNVITSALPSASLFYGDGGAASGITLTLGQEATAGDNIISYSTAISKTTLAGTGGGTAGQASFLRSGSIYGDDDSSTAVGRDAFFGGGTGSAGDAIGLRLDGLAAGNYLIYIMARNMNSDVPSLPLNIFSSVGSSADTFNFSALTANVENNTAYAAADYTDQYNTFQDGENYVGLNVTVNSGNSLYLAVDGASATETRGFLNMVEVVPVPVPEPAAWAVFGMGIFALLPAFKKRRTI